MDAVRILLLGLWLTWAALLLACRVTLARLGNCLTISTPPLGELIRFRQDSLDFLQPFRWYLHVRHFARQRTPGTARSAAIDTLTTRLRRLLVIVEIEFAALVVAIATVMAHSVLTGAWGYLR